MPAYNEDDEALRQCLQSMLTQTRPLDAIAVTDDGSTTGNYAQVRAWFLQECAARGVTGHWERTANGGKRHAQITGVRHELGADVFLTVDSDTILDPDAVRHGLQPFADERVQSVAGIVLTANYGANLLTRMQELWFTTLQMVNRGALSSKGSVMVNCGGLAFYRSGVILDNLDTYLGETLFGRPMHASDDSLLTLWALQRGRAVQQSTSFAFTLMPTKFSHHRRQQLRWMRGSTVRSAWRFRHLPLRSFAYWYHLAKWAQYGAVTVTVGVLAATGMLSHPVVLVWGGLVMVGLQLLLNLPYLTLRRSDQSVGQRLAVYATAPLVGLWQITVMRVLRWYAMGTFRKVASVWGTRGTVEVAALAA
ncbi:glycosyltransferase family 2 protein [Cellulomonas rhizosphaerae]|uniref:glycosyltransferase family 2 protein n=1 Tax=Cellulomonas rhizosphaerae TaxID=2293719 RepID=UPI001314D7AB|nr:glycosyltransferase family 2 protein [Cellulomonas rhizosphaerae]